MTKKTPPQKPVAKKSLPAKNAPTTKKSSKRKRSSGGVRRSATESVLYAVRAATARERLKALLLTVLTGCMVFLAFPRYDVYPLLWFAFVPLLVAISSRRAWPAFFWGLLAGTITNWGGFHWVTGMLMDFGHFSTTVAILFCNLLCMYQGLVVGLWAGLTRWLVLRTGWSMLVIAPVTWVAVEYCLPFIFPWYLANGQYLFYPAIQITEVVGVPGLSFIIMLVNVALYQAVNAALTRRWTVAWRPAALAAAVFGLNVVYGLVRIHQVDAQMAESATIRIGIGEANVGIFEKEARHLKGLSAQFAMLRGNILKHHLLARELEEKHQVDLVVLPESSFIPVPFPYQTVRFKRSDLFALVGGAGRDLWELRDQEWSGPRVTTSDTPAIVDIHAAREDTIFAVGPPGKVLFRSGDQWSAEVVPTEAALTSVWAGPRRQDFEALDDLPITAFAVGPKGLVLRRAPDGSWRTVAAKSKANLTAIHGTSASRAFMVGAAGTILRWDGSNIITEHADTTVALHGVWCAANDRVYAVGDQGILLTRTASGWSKKKLTSARFHDIAGRDGRALIVGAAGNVWESTGGAFKRLEFPVTVRLDAVAIDGRGDDYVVGGGNRLWVRRRGESAFKEVEGLRDLRGLNTVAGIPFTRGHAYARDSRFIYRSAVPLPEVDSALEAVANIDGPLSADSDTQGRDWNTPLRGFNTPLLLGLLTYEPKDPSVSGLTSRDARRTYNSAMLVDPDGRVRGRYDKNYLLIFGEYIPFGDVFPQFYDWLPEASHFYPGETVETFEFKGHQIGVMICYEDILPGFTRNLAGKDPNVLINVTNDAWFGKTAEPYLHLALSVFRAVENRLWLIRSTNTGVSAFVDATGRIVSETSLDDAEVLVADVPMLRTSTPYRSFGDLFAYGNLVVFAVFMVAGIGYRRRERRRTRK